MPFNGSGAFMPPGSSFPAVAGTLIEAAKFNNVINDIATGLSTCITKDGQTTVTANIPMGGFKFTGLAAGTAAADSARLSQVQSSGAQYVTSVAGTNTITGGLTPTLTAYAAGQRFMFKAANTNTGATTINIDAVGAKNIYSNGAALVGGEIIANQIITVVYDGTQFQIQQPSTFLQSGTSATARTVQAKLRDMVSVTDFGAVTDGSADATAAFNAAIAAASTVYVPDGTYRIDGTVEVSAGKALNLSEGALLIRYTASSAATTPVVYVIGIAAELNGGTVQTQNAHPNGVVCLGNKSSSDNRNAWWWRFRNCTVKGSNTASNIGVNVPSGQVTHAVANYFGCIENINIYGADVGMLLSEYANAHNISNIQYWDCRTACLELRGAYANNVSNQFMHAGAASGVIAVKISNKTVGSQESTLNNIIGFTTETGGVADKGVTIDSNCTKNTVIGNDNVAGGNSVANADNFVLLRGILRYCTQLGADAVATPAVTFPATQVPSADANTLDDYEEGTWTPTASGITGTNTYAGTYTKIGNRVYWEIIITTASTIGITGASSTLSLPFTAGTDSTCAAANRSTGGGYGNGLVTGGLAWPPTAGPSASQTVVVSGMFKV